MILLNFDDWKQKWLDIYWINNIKICIIKRRLNQKVFLAINGKNEFPYLIIKINEKLKNGNYSIIK